MAGWTCTFALPLQQMPAITADPAAGGGRGVDGGVEVVRLGTPRPQAEADVAIETLLDEAREERAGGRHSLAEMLYKTVLVRDPNNLSALLELADVYKETGKLEYARGLLTRASLLRPGDADIIERSQRVAGELASALETEVDSLLEIGAYDLALPKLSILLTIQPENSDLYFKKAVCHFHLHRPDAVIPQINMALKLRKDERYYDIRREALARIQMEKINALTREVVLSLLRTSPEAREETLSLLGHLLELDSDNEWARTTFMELSSEGQGTTLLLGRRVPASRATELLNDVVRWVRRESVKLFEVLYKHIRLLIGLLTIMLILRSPLTFLMLRGFSPRPLLSGKLSQFNIHEILSLINGQNHSGVLRIRTKSAKGIIYIENGEAYHCKSKRLVGREALKHLLDNAREGYFTFVEKRVSIDRTISTPLSLILMDLPDRKGISPSRNRPKLQRSRMKELLDSKK
jgi:tetratricopeptide (TPR) repeat protein